MEKDDTVLITRNITQQDKFREAQDSLMLVG